MEVFRKMHFARKESEYRDLAATLPEVKSEHDDVGVTDEMLKEFCKWAFENHVGRYKLCVLRSLRARMMFIT